MSKQVVRDGDSTSCGHTVGGTSSTVIINGKGASKKGVSSAGGTVQGGASTVVVEGVPINLIGDAVSPHGDSPHNSSVVTSGSDTVFAS